MSQTTPSLSLNTKVYNYIKNLWDGGRDLVGFGVWGSGFSQCRAGFGDQGLVSVGLEIQADGLRILRSGWCVGVVFKDF